MIIEWVDCDLDGCDLNGCELIGSELIGCELNYLIAFKFAG
ncbi:MAG: pentapeptide repeat-containing protein [Prochlorococcus sp.]